MPRKIALLIAGTAGLAFAALAPDPSRALPANGGFLPNVETGVVQVVCIQKSGGQVVCGYYDQYGNFHQSKGDYDRGYRGYEGGYRGYDRPRGPSGYTCVQKSSGQVVCGYYDQYGNFHPSKGPY
jgi:uncharacterized protein YodC (DUF2158 family)